MRWFGLNAPFFHTQYVVIVLNKTQHNANNLNYILIIYNFLDLKTILREVVSIIVDFARELGAGSRKNAHSWIGHAIGPLKFVDRHIKKHETPNVECSWIEVLSIFSKR